MENSLEAAEDVSAEAIERLKDALLRSANRAWPLREFDLHRAGVALLLAWPRWLDEASALPPDLSMAMSRVAAEVSHLRETVKPLVDALLCDLSSIEAAAELRQVLRGIGDSPTVRRARKALRAHGTLMSAAKASRRAAALAARRTGARIRAELGRNLPRRPARMTTVVFSVRRGAQFAGNRVKITVQAVLRFACAHFLR